MTDDHTRLWCMHHIGPDDVHPAPDFDTAQKWADWANKAFAEHAEISRFVVAIWPWSAESHAEGLDASVAGWTLPEGSAPSDQEKLVGELAEALQWAMAFLLSPSKHNTEDYREHHKRYAALLTRARQSGSAEQ